MDLCDINYIKFLLAKYDFKFSKGLGQNFLCDAEVPEMTASLCGADKDTCVLEVGPGIGTLTRPLARRAKKVVSLELDRRLFPVLAETLADLDNTEAIEGDVLKTDLSALIDDRFGGARAVACANLPYYITTPAIEALIKCKRFDSITVMVQKEVAARMAADAGGKDYGAFTVYINYHAVPNILFDVPSSCFIPRPKVDSSVIRLDILKGGPLFEVDDETVYFKTVRGAFSQRRKTLSNALSSAFPALDKLDIIGAIKACGFDETIRGEKLSPKDFAILANKLCKII